LQKAKKKAGGGSIGGEKSSKQKTKDEEQESPVKNSIAEDGPVEAEAANAEEKAKQEPDILQLDQDEALLKDAIAAAEAAPPAHETVTSPEGITGQGGPDASPGDTTAIPKTRGIVHGRQASLSIQSKMRSDSFRKTSTVGPLSPSAAPRTLPDLTPDGETMNDIYRKQALRLDELERENKRLDKEAREGEARWRRSEEELEELREASGEASALKLQAKKEEESQSKITMLKGEIASLERQLQQRGHSHSVSRTMRSPSIPTPGDSTGSPDSLKREIESKDSTIADMELEISRLRGVLSTKTSSCETHGSQISALQDKLASMQNKLRNVEGELADSKRALTRASEKAVKEGVERTSSDTKMKGLQRELAEASEARDDIVKKAEKLEKKLETMNKLHREAEARNASKLSAAEMQGREAGMLKARLAASENETLKLREERDRRKKREVTGADDEGIDELENEERVRLERHVRELEAEIFDLKRGVWRERRKELQPNSDVDTEGAAGTGDGGDFDEVDLSGNAPSSQGRNLAAQSAQQKHSSLSTVFSSGLAAFRGSPEHTTRPRQDSLLHELDDDSAFDEEAFAVAQREEEARKMVEHVREVKRKLRDWEGWRLDLVDARKSAAGMLETGFYEIFEV
jgi:DNA repair exonuclease SbcCD ATPase subunit